MKKDLTPDEIHEVREQINDLLEQLPFHERGDYDVFLLAVDLQQELSALIRRKSDQATDAATIQALIDASLKKQKGLEQLQSIADTIRSVWTKLTAAQQADVSSKGFAIKTIMQQKNKDIEDAIRTANERGNIEGQTAEG